MTADPTCSKLTAIMKENQSLTIIDEIKDRTRAALKRLPAPYSLVGLAEEAGIPAASLYQFKCTGIMGIVKVVALEKALRKYGIIK